MEEMEGIVAVGPELAVVVVKDDEFNVVTLGRAAAAETSEAALEDGTPGGAVLDPAALDEISLHLASSVSGVEVLMVDRIVPTGEER